MGDIVDLHRQPISHEGEFNSELVTDLARFAEGLTTEKDIKRRYRFDDAVWESLGSNEALFAAIEDEKVRRVRNGALKRERAQALVTSAPGVLGEILCDPNANPRHRIDSAKELNNFAANTPESAPASDRYIIQINIGDDTLTFNKSIKPDSSNHIDDTLEEWLPAIASREEDDSGNTV